MSLLLDALRQAEQQKQQGKEFTLPDRSENTALALEPLAGPGTPLPELPARLEELDDQFGPTGAMPKKSGPASTSTQGAVATPSPPMADPPAREGSPLYPARQVSTTGYPFTLIAGIAGGVALAGLGGYLYSQMPAQSSLVPHAAQPHPPSASPPHPLPPAAPTSPASPAPPPSASLALPVSSPTKPVATLSRPESAPAAPAPPARPPLGEGASPPLEPHGISFRRSTHSAAPPAGNAETAYTAFMQGELALARTLWLKMLRTDPFEPNALHGLAVLALREGRTDEAAALYRRALEADPHDALAVAGLLPLEGMGDPRQAELRLKRLLADQPDAPRPNFALANLFASQARWAEAQQAYFKAHVADPDNPDFLYNLAVSLDHLHQPGLAEQFYTRALIAAKTRQAAFDPAAVAVRLQAAPPGQLQ